MERKEAIEILKKHHMWTGEPSEVVDVRLENKALQMAIASLETDEAYQLEYEKPEICEDCISRKEIIDRCNNVILHGVVDKEGMHPISAETLLKETESMPSVMPKATKNDCETCIHNKGVLECDMYGCKYEPTTKNDLGVDCISRKSIKQKLQEHHDFFVNAYGGFSNLPQNDKSRVDEITNCIAMVVNEPSVTPQEPRKGHWIETAEEYYKAVNEKGGGVNENTDFFTDDIACSECLAKFSVIDNEADRFDFCPCCGSDNR